MLPDSFSSKLRVILHILTESWILAPAEYPFADKFKEVPPERWNDLIANVDSDSQFELKEFIRRLNNSNIFWPEGKKLCFMMRSEYAIDKFPIAGKSRELKQLQRRFSLSGGEESLRFHHGAALLSEKAKLYIHDKVIVDAGACFGDFTIPVVFAYSPRHVLAFEPNVNSTRKLVKNLKRNKIPLDRCRIFNAALGDCEQEVFFDSSDIRMDQPGKMRTVIRPLDDIETIMDHPVGLIKADVEGMGTELLRGAVKTIEKFRPILALSCYHSEAELFGQYQFVNENFSNYQISFTALPPGSGFEFTMLAVPGELC